MERMKYLDVLCFQGSCLVQRRGGRAGGGGVRDKLGLGGILELAGVERGAWDNLECEELFAGLLLS